MNKLTVTLLTGLLLSLMSPVIYAADTPDLSDITMDVIHSEDAREITNEIELPEQHEDHDRHADGRKDDPEKLEDRERDEEPEKTEERERDEEPEKPEEPEKTEEHESR